jgi:hypothetical protein
MTRTWPFEHLGEPLEPFRTPADFISRRGPGIAGVVVRIGLGDAQLVLVDAEGLWERWVYPSTDEAVRVARDLGVPHHVGDYPEDVRLRMNARVRSPQEFARGPYPEEGRVGPVRPYPENRPRRVEEAEEDHLGPHPGGTS